MGGSRCSTNGRSCAHARAASSSARSEAVSRPPCCRRCSAQLGYSATSTNRLGIGAVLVDPVARGARAHLHPPHLDHGLQELRHVGRLHRVGDRDQYRAVLRHRLELQVRFRPVDRRVPIQPAHVPQRAARQRSPRRPRAAPPRSAAQPSPRSPTRACPTPRRRAPDRRRRPSGRSTGRAPAPSRAGTPAGCRSWWPASQPCGAGRHQHHQNRYQPGCPGGDRGAPRRIPDGPAGQVDSGSARTPPEAARKPPAPRRSRGHRAAGRNRSHPGRDPRWPPAAAAPTLRHPGRRRACADQHPAHRRRMPHVPDAGAIAAGTARARVSSAGAGRIPAAPGPSRRS